MLDLPYVCLGQLHSPQCISPLKATAMEEGTHFKVLTSMSVLQKFIRKSHVQDQPAPD